MENWKPVEITQQIKYKMLFFDERGTRAGEKDLSR